MKPSKRSAHLPAFITSGPMFAILALLSVSLACVAFGQRQPGVQRSSPESCDAIGEVAITLGELSEEQTIEADGSQSGVECSYSYHVENTGSEAVILVYFDHFFYGDNPPPNDYEFGWNKTASIPPGESWNLGSSLTSYPKQPLYLDMITHLAVIPDSPACAWLVSDGIDPEIFRIETYQPLEPPCQLVSPFSDPNAAPDLLLGLRED